MLWRCLTDWCYTPEVKLIVFCCSQNSYVYYATLEILSHQRLNRLTLGFRTKLSMRGDALFHMHMLVVKTV